MADSFLLGSTTRPEEVTPFLKKVFGSSDVLRPAATRFSGLRGISWTKVNLVYLVEKLLETDSPNFLVNNPPTSRR